VCQCHSNGSFSNSLHPTGLHDSWEFGEGIPAATCEANPDLGVGLDASRSNGAAAFQRQGVIKGDDTHPVGRRWKAVERQLEAQLEGLALRWRERCFWALHLSGCAARQADLLLRLHSEHAQLEVHLVSICPLQHGAPVK
jgi:hypothetical protein